MAILEYLHPEFLLIQGGLWLVILIVFFESGCFFGFFLPGDSLLFTAGLLCGTGIFPVNINILLISLFLAAVAGYFVGYFSGKFFGHLIRKNENRWIKSKHLQITESFYNRYGILTIIIGRFIPIVRTFAPIMAGLVYAPFGKFFLYNILGALIWVILLVYLGFWLGGAFPQVRDYLEIIIISLILVSAIPAVLNFRKNKFAN